MPRKDDSAKSSPSTPLPSQICVVDGCSRFRQVNCDHMCISHYRESQEADESSEEECDNPLESDGSGEDDALTSSDDSAIEWSCHLCAKQNGPDKTRCNGCMAWRTCLVAGCTNRRQKDCDGMCTTHFKEAREANESSDECDSDDELDTHANATGGSRCNEKRSLEDNDLECSECAEANEKNSLGTCPDSADRKPAGEGERDEGIGQEAKPAGTKSEKIHDAGTDAASSADGAAGTATKSEEDQMDTSSAKPLNVIGEAPNLQSVVDLLCDDGDDDDDNPFGYFGMEL